MTDGLWTETSDLIRRQSTAVDAKLGEMLAARGIDPTDRSDGWEDRARAALGDLEIVDSYDMSDDYRMTATTVIRPRSVEHSHWPEGDMAVGSPQRPAYPCSCGAAVALDKSTGKFEPVTL